MRTRADLAKRVPDGGTMIELGVAAGKFAAQLLEANRTARYVGIDRWSDHHDEAERERAIDAIEAAGHGRATTIRATFTEARQRFAPASAALVYVDGYAHTGQEGGRTLDEWFSVVEPGGTFAGHDYDPDHYPETVLAVDEFAARVGLTVNVIDERPHPSWWMVKVG